MSKESSKATSNIRKLINPFQKVVKHTDVSAGYAGSVQGNTNAFVISTERPLKKVKLNENTSNSLLVSPSLQHATLMGPDEGTNVTPKVAPEGLSKYMQQFLEELPRITASIFEYNGGCESTRVCACGELGPFRCRDCWKSPHCCLQCLLSQHYMHPFHLVEKFNGRYYQRQEWTDLGLVIGLEHEHETTKWCPHVRSEAIPKKITIVHTNGMHTVFLNICECPDAPSFIAQLCRHGLFPATVEDQSRLTTAFTFHVLEDFQMHMLTSKESAYDFCQSLSRRTNQFLPQTVPNKYHEFLRVSRIWSHIQTVMKSGQAHDIDKILIHRMKGTLATRCPACPELNFNMPEDFDIAKDRDNLIHRRWISADGNFSARRLKKKHDPDDVALADGKAYFVNDRKYQQYLEGNSNLSEKSTCANLKAVNTQNRAKFKNADVTGIVAIVCGRHGLLMPSAVVDLQLGEKYVNVDYALAGALREIGDLSVGFTYDVACQYTKHLVDRLESNVNLCDVMPTVNGMKAGIAKMHQAGHVDDCTYEFGLNYLEGVGRLSGEGVETVWSENNKVNGSAKQMNPGHRHDTLDAHFDDWNWNKVIRMSQLLRVALIKAYEMAHETQIYFEKIDVAPMQKESWYKLSTKPYWEKGELKSVYKPESFKAPTQSHVFQDLLKRRIMRSEESKDNKDVIYINEGLQLLEKQCKIKDTLHEYKETASKRLEEDIQSARTKLRQEINTWREYQIERLPDLESLVDDTHTETPENEGLLLPSDFDSVERQNLGMLALATIELELRRGVANDALQGVRLAIKSLSRDIQFKRKEIFGQHDNTRANSMLRTKFLQRNQYAVLYRKTRQAMLQLGVSSTDQTYQELREEDMHVKSLLKAHELGSGTSHDSWIWQHISGVRLPHLSENDWENDTDRVVWFRARAKCDRWQEEVQILEEEFKRTERSFNRMSEVWEQLGDKVKETVEGEGKQIYAYKWASVYTILAEQCKKDFVKAIEHKL